MLNLDFFEDRPAKAMNCTVRCPKPVLQFPGKKVQLGFQVGRWPKNLFTEKVV